MHNIAFIYDFDGTLLRGTCLDHHLLPDLGITKVDKFWSQLKRQAHRENIDEISMYMYKLMELGQAQNKPLTPSLQRAYGKKLTHQLHAGLTGKDNWFVRNNQRCLKAKLRPSHYIVSSGLQQIIAGCSIKSNFKKIYASDYLYDRKTQHPRWPAWVINHTAKTQYLFRINKGVLDPNDDNKLNESLEPEERPVPFANMIFIGDGFTDIPCFSVVKKNRGHALAVLKGTGEADLDQISKLVNDNRVDSVSPGKHFVKDSMLDKAVVKIIKKIAQANS